MINPIFGYPCLHVKLVIVGLLLCQKMNLLVLFVASAILLPLLSASTEEKMEYVPAIQFAPASESPILSKLQVYPVVVLPERSARPEIPVIYASVFFRDCSKRYTKIQIVSLEVQAPDGKWKIRFKIHEAQNDGTLVIPQLLPEGITDEMLSEEGKKMMRTKETYFLAAPENAEAAKNAFDVLQHYETVKFYLEFTLAEQQASHANIKHTFDLKQEKIKTQIITYTNGDESINESVFVPEVPAGCVDD